MRRLQFSILSILSLFYTTSIFAQLNYARTWTATAPDNDPNHLLFRPLTDVKQVTQYIDGLGRPLQSVAKQGSLETATGNNMDLVTPRVYDALGREPVSYLPYVTTTTDGSYQTDAMTAQPFFYSSTSILAGQNENGTNAHSLIQFETSPLSRPIATYAPGNSWVGSSNVNRSIQQGYWLNTIADDVKMFTVGNTSLPAFANYTVAGAYPAGTLYKSITTDENQKQVIEFRDIEGRTILKKVQLTGAPDDGTGTGYTGWLCTYYIYDNMGLLRCIVQPDGVAQPTSVATLSSNGWVFTSTILAQQCLRYEYDARNRMIMKQVPGASPVYMVYDNLDRMVMTQDGNLRAANKWTAIIYDNLDRPIETGIFPGTAGDLNLQLGQAYISPSYPGANTLTEVLNITHYDDYNSLPTGLSSSMVAGTWSSIFSATNNSASGFPYPQMPAPNSTTTTMGRATWTQVEVLNSSPAIYESMVNIYDDKGRVIQNTVLNPAITTNITNTTQYTWAGQPLVQVQAQTNTKTSNQLTIVSLLSYDALGRVVKTQKQVGISLVNSGTLSQAVTTAILQYDALGDLKNKFLGNQATGMATYRTVPLESQQFDYNIRGWLLGVNRASLWDNGSVDNTVVPTPTNSTGEAYTGPHSGTFWAFELGYDKVTSDQATASGSIGLSTVYNAAQYNGNIAGMVWKSNNDIKLRKYDYTYDAANRILKADFNQYTGTGFNKTAGLDFSVQMGNGIDPTSAYDANGNILSMTQMGFIPSATAPPTPIILDALTYTYMLGNGASNQLQQVVDASPSNGNKSTLGDFHYATATTTKTVGGSTDYAYDANGNLTSDANKQIAKIVYNYLGLPYQITMKGGGISYKYDALGNKLSKIVINTATGIVTTTTYVQGVVYLNGNLQSIPQEEGRVRVATSGGTAYYVYDYFLKDHLGNTRMTVTDDYAMGDPIIDVTHYYPNGLAQAGISGRQNTVIAENKYKFGGKEIQHGEFSDGSGLEFYDFGARMFDPQIGGRFWQIDPLADKTPNWSPYVAMGDNPIRHIDPTGKKYINFDANGNYVNTTKDNWWHNLWHGSTGKIAGLDGKAEEKFKFSDPKNDVADIQSGKIKRVEFVKDGDIDKMMQQSGVFDASKKSLAGGLGNISYIIKQSHGGKLDFSYGAIPEKYPEASRDVNNDKVPATPMIFLVKSVGIAYNHSNYGNFLWGAASEALGFNIDETLWGAQLNSLGIFGNKNGYPSQFDSSDDQDAIAQGFIYGFGNGYNVRTNKTKITVGPLE